MAHLVLALGALQCVAALEHRGAPPRAGVPTLRLPHASVQETGEYSRLSLRGGGIPPPLIPLAVVMGGTSIALKLNEDLRGRVLKIVQNLKSKLPGGKGGKLSGRPKVVIPEGLDVRNGTWAYEVNEITPGCLLVASPDTFRFAGPRQVLDQSVILLVRHGKSGSSGFIINRPTQFDVGDVTKKLAAFEQNPLYLGGDIGEECT